MQWLIDLVLEAIGGPPFFIDRGDPATPDTLAAFLTKDGNWHDLDLSGIVPTNAVAVLMSCIINTDIVEAKAEIRKKGNVNTNNLTRLHTQVGIVDIGFDIVCPIGSDGLLEYRFDNTIWNLIKITVKGWWL